MQTPIKTSVDIEGVWSVFYFDKLIGWIHPAKSLSKGRAKVFRAMSIHGDLKHVYSLKMGKDWVMSVYF